MKTKYTSKLLIGAATLSLATFISQGNAEASEKTSSLADAQPATFESSNVSPEQKAFYQVLHMDGISESQRDQYIKQLHEGSNSAQNVFSESIKDATNPERRVAQQNAFYGLLHNEDLSDKQRDAFISEIKENPDQSQDVFVKSLNSTPEAAPQTEQPKAPHNPILEKENQSIADAKNALQALQQEDTIQNRRAAQRAINKLPKNRVNVDDFQKQLDAINGPRDAKIKADAEAKQKELQIGKSPEVEKTPVPIENPEANTEQKPEANDSKSTEKTPQVEDKKSEKAPEVEKAPKVEKTPEVQAPKLQTPQVENKTETDKVADSKKAEEASPSTETTPEMKNNIESNSVVPVLPETGEATTSTLSSYWNAFKDSVNKGYTYVKDGITSGLNYLKGQYEYITGKYNDAKYYSKLYKNHKTLIDTTVLAFLNDNGTKAYIEPLKIDKDANVFTKSYAQTRNFVTESINTGKVLYTLYQNPSVVKGAIKTAQAIDTAKNAFSSILSFFK
ncbi:B domain-containing protein [Staphylococcus intermedius]|uniref:Immunoglobulin-binding protein Sbi n=1 Tax=Staphylococcus intermedius NCTC 11048 TaxID=1141106 RepID=A0A380G538_STAIN|nr:B domain-containing protein [Staphylococcus intermedius]PCF64298.1 IgG-binding protein SBI [Staphylococcus intermedius]PCF79014.1 IgG-binding protein SBI [Staphylococcus intermedius]PCF79986.1 IgG-binding protein SBI [Staphylococcus intermedius]PCF89354.1 IgG-binding protein SBI [Staphylococcus intermedius]PNZ52119.1 IgG-binding protein SBI [Staphylococcus intermedius NCTC 11048]